MKTIIAVSDTHSFHRKIKRLPEADFLIHAGDFTWQGETKTLVDFGNWLREQTQIRHKIIIAGNHELGFENYYTRHEALNIIGEGFIYLQDSGVEIEGLSFYGTPWQPRFCDWEFNADESQLKEKFKQIPGALDFLITHGPPKGVLDNVLNQYDGVGSPALLDRILVIKPKVCIWGHIHEANGYKLIENTHCFNVSFQSGSFQTVNPPIQIQYDEIKHEIMEVDQLRDSID